MVTIAIVFGGSDGGYVYGLYSSIIVNPFHPFIFFSVPRKLASIVNEIAF